MDLIKLQDVINRIALLSQDEQDFLVKLNKLSPLLAEKREAEKLELPEPDFGNFAKYGSLTK